ncbi:DUF1905 domain-containing protein [Geodermatophilus sp. SYSU D00684]
MAQVVRGIDAAEAAQARCVGPAMSPEVRPGLTGMTPEDLATTFTAPIEKDGAFPTYLTVPGSAELFGTRKAVKVGGTIDGHPFTATCMPSGEGPHWLPLRKALCRAIGKDAAGQEVSVHLEQRFT